MAAKSETNSINLLINSIYLDLRRPQVGVSGETRKKIHTLYKQLRQAGFQSQAQSLKNDYRNMQEIGCTEVIRSCIKKLQDFFPPVSGPSASELAEKKIALLSKKKSGS